MSKRKPISYERKKRYIGWFYVLPWLFGLVYFFLIPLGFSVVYSFEQMEITPGPTSFSFVGLQ